MKKLALLIVLVVAFALMGGVALAAETPHGPFDNNSAVCAACHRAHTSTAEYLLATPRVTSLCIACHDGSGADTDVVNGALIVNGTQLDKTINPGDPTYPHVQDNGYNHGTWGTADHALMGGGFMKVGYGGLTTNTSSKHMDPTGGAALTTYALQFGAGAAASNGPGTAKIFLDCVDCHMPHRSPNYRMLRVKPTGYSGNNLIVPQATRVSSNNSVVSDTNATESAAYTAGAFGRRYTEDEGMFNYYISNPTAANAEGISKWCGLGCHDFYYRSAVRGNNGEVAGPSPSMQTRVQTTIAVGSMPTASVTVVDASAIDGTGLTYIWIRGVQYHVTAKASNVLTVDPQIAVADQPTAITAGIPVSIEGKGMEVYYNLDGVAGQDPGFMHAIDVDLNYYPRNLSSGLQNLSVNLGGGNARFNNLMPVADQTNNTTYDATDRMTCLTCHRAHGTDVPMNNEAAIGPRAIGGARVPAGVAFPAGSDSMLLRLENRATCQQCHEMPTGF